MTINLHSGRSMIQTVFMNHDSMKVAWAVKKSSQLDLVSRQCFDLTSLFAGVTNCTNDLTIRLSLWRVATGNPLTFTLSPPECHMEIREGHGTTGVRVAGPVRVGDPITLVVYMRSEHGIFLSLSLSLSLSLFHWILVRFSQLAR